MYEAAPDHPQGIVRSEAEDPRREPDVDQNGVDLTLVRYTLSLTPSERLLALERFMNVLATARPLGRESM